MCEHKIRSHILCPSNQQGPTAALESGSSKHSNCPPFDFPKPCKLECRTSVSTSSTVEKTGLLAGTTWKQHVQATEEKWSWLTLQIMTLLYLYLSLARDDSAIPPLTTASFYCLNTASATLNSAVEWSVTEERPNTTGSAVSSDMGLCFTACQWVNAIMWLT